MSDKFETHQKALEIYNHNKTTDDPTYRNPIYLAKAMTARDIGRFTVDGRTKFTHSDVIKYIHCLDKERKQKAQQRRRAEPRWGVSPEYIMYLSRSR